MEKGYLKREQTFQVAFFVRVFFLLGYFMSVITLC